MASATRTIGDESSGRSAARVRGPFSRLTASPPLLAGVLVFTMAFGLYAATTDQSLGYDPETAAVAEGLVRTGHLREVEGSPLQTFGAQGRGLHLYSRVGVLQPLLEAPFYAVGWAWDEASSGSRDFNHRRLVMMFYNPLLAALATAALFAFMYMARGSLPWAAVVAALSAVASVAWPYAKIGMEPTLMCAVIVAFALAVYARGRTTPLSWAATGFAAGAATATRAHGAVTILAVGVLLWPAFRSLDRAQRIKLAVAFGLPVLAWLSVDAWYNWDRFGSLLGIEGGNTDRFGNDLPAAAAVLAASMLALYLRRHRSRLFWPFVFSAVAVGIAMAASTAIGTVGLLASPGKGLILYSPLVVLGALGVSRLWRQDPWLTASLALMFSAVTVLGAASGGWGDETWGPRYLVPVAWIPLVPIAWWASTGLRRRVLAGVAALAILVQVVGVYDRYDRYYAVATQLTGVTPYGPRVGEIKPRQVPYGDDPPRWIPELSPLALGAEGILSRAVEPLTGEGLKVTYAPLDGPSRTIDLSTPGLAAEPYFWWWTSYDGIGSRFAAALLLSLSVAGGVGLYKVCKASSQRPRAA